MIADYTGRPKQTVNNVVRTLKSEGHVTLSAECADRREKRIVLTEKGHAYSKEILAPLYDLEERIFGIMGAERVQQMIDAIMLFNSIFEKEMKRRKKENERKTE